MNINHFTLVDEIYGDDEYVIFVPNIVVFTFARPYKQSKVHDRKMSQPYSYLTGSETVVGTGEVNY